MELFTPGHLIVVAVVAAVLFFGWKQLPDMSRSLGRSLRIFKTEIKGMTEDDKARDTAKAQEEQAPKAVEPRALPKAEIVNRSAAPRPRPRPAPSVTSDAQSPGSR